MSEKEKQQWLEQAEKMMLETQSTADAMAALRSDVHARIAAQLFAAFPFLADAMEPEEMRHLGERIHRHVHALTHELTDFAYTVQQRTV